MARKFLTAVDFAKNEIQNAVIQVLASAPATPSVGQLYYNSTSGRAEYRGASAWIDPTARATHSGTQLASTISDFSATAQSIRLDQFAAPITSVSLNNQKITNVLTPTLDTDAANKGYVDAAVNGTDWKQSVRAGTTVNISLTALQVIDGITTIAGDRILVKDQTTGSTNGIYVASSGAWTRALDADANVEVTAGLAVMITEGTTQGDSQWRLITDDVITLGTTALVFTQIGAATSYTGGTGITITGNSIAINTAVVSRKFAATIGDGTSTSIAVTHSFGTTDVVVQVYEVTGGATVECDVLRNSTSQVTLGFTLAPAASTLRVVVQG